MTCYGIGAKILGRKVDKKTAISFPALLTLLRNPYTIYHLGFLFSYLGNSCYFICFSYPFEYLKKKNKREENYSRKYQKKKD